MSLRLSSLNPNEPRAVKDCRNCNRRRIRCDRGLPTCKKCQIKGLECPGYGLRIRWGTGVASRGRLSGKTVPIVASPTNKSDSSATEYVDSRSQSPILTPAEDTAAESAVEHSARNVALNNEFASNQDYTSSTLPAHLLGRSQKYLLRYFDHVVAPLMSWIDGPDNEWRTIMIPLALNCQPLLLALLALAAEHFAAKTGSIWDFEGGSTSDQYRDQSLRLLTQNLRSEMNRAHAMGQEGPQNEILATTIVLCNLGMIHSDLWHLHWQGVRMIIRRWAATSDSPAMKDRTWRFLLMDAFMYDAFASCTTFDGSEQISGNVVPSEDIDLLVEYLQLIQEITALERKCHFTLEMPELSNFKSLQERFDYCHKRDLYFAGKMMQSYNTELQEDFNAVVDMFHHAGMLYGCQALLEDSRYASTRQDCMNSTIEAIRRIRNRGPLLQNFVWPLFLVGTEARRQNEIQHFIESQFDHVMRSTSWRNCARAVVFLKRFWKMDEAATSNWIAFAREESARGFTFLVI